MKRRYVGRMFHLWPGIQAEERMYFCSFAVVIELATCVKLFIFFKRRYMYVGPK